MDDSIILLCFIRDLIDSQYLDGHWITSHGGSVSCDVGAIHDWFYSIFLPDLLKRKDISHVMRIFIEENVR